MSTIPIPPAPMKGSSKIEKLWRSGDPLEYVETMPQSQDNPLDQMYKQMQQYDQSMCEGWRDEIEHLLIFAGLFSATVTAFIVLSYGWLQRDNSDLSVKLLYQISLQLANSSTPLSVNVDEPFTPSSRNIRINIFWFTSLVLCLSTVIFGILCTQWLREFTRVLSLSTADAITIRQMRYDGLYRWKVPTIVDWLPAILQASVLLFFAGVLDLLWSLHRTVAAVVTVFVGLVTLGIVFTTAAPVIQTVVDFRHFLRVGHDLKAYVVPCPYRSPLSWIVLRLVMMLDPVLFTQRRVGSSWAAFDIFSHERSLAPSVGKKAYNAKGLARALHWVIARLSPELNQDIPQDIYHLLHDVIDRPTSGAVLLNWVELTRESQNLKTTLYELRSSGMSHGLYDLLLERLLRRALPIQENRKILLELQVRCLNTLGDKKMADMGEVFWEAARNCYYYLLENKDVCSLNDDGLLFQSLMTIMKFYNRLYDYRRMPTVADCVGSVLDKVLRDTEVKDSNASLCCQVLDQFKFMLEGVDKCVEDLSIPNQNLHSAVQLLQRLDLHAIKKWEMDIQHITRENVPLIDQMIPFLEKLDSSKEQADAGVNVGNVKGQLDAFRKSRTWRYESMF